MITNWFFYTKLKELDFTSKIAGSFDIFDSHWETYQKNQTPLNDQKSYLDCLDMQVVSDENIRRLTTLHSDFLNFLNFKDENFPIKFTMKVFNLPVGSRFTPHFDNPKCAIVYHFNDIDPLNFYNESDSIICSAKYKFALLNTSIKHGIDTLKSNRIWFKISVHNYSYFQMREIFYRNNLIE